MQSHELKHEAGHPKHTEHTEHTKHTKHPKHTEHTKHPKHTEHIDEGRIYKRFELYSNFEKDTRPCVLLLEVFKERLDHLIDVQSRKMTCCDVLWGGLYALYMGLFGWFIQPQKYNLYCNLIKYTMEHDDKKSI
jgi:hypothetical protein